MEENIVLWECKTCGWRWKGKSPRFRTIRPYCTRCGSWSVKIKDWLIDKNKWEEVKEIVVKRAEGKCEACGNEAKFPRIHHVEYNNYYDPEKMVCLCSRCHAVVHKKMRPYGISKALLSFGIIFTFIGIIFTTGIIRAPELNLRIGPLFIPFFVGIGFIISGIRLRRDIRKTKRAIRQTVRRRSKRRNFQVHDRDDQ